MSMMKDVKPFSILLASFACLLRKFTYEEDLVIGSSSRSFNPLVFRLDVGGEAGKGEGEKRMKSLGELVMQTQEAEKRAEENEIDFDDLIAGLRRERGLDNDALASLFQVSKTENLSFTFLKNLSHHSPRSAFSTLLMSWFPLSRLPNVTGMFSSKWRGLLLSSFPFLFSPFNPTLPQ